MDSLNTAYSVGIIVILFLTGIPIAEASIPEPEKMNYWPTHEWKTSTPESQGMDSEVLNSMVNQYNQETIDVDSLLIIRNGYIVLEEYFSDSNQNITHHIYSCTKSITSTLIGIAITRGLIESTDLVILDILSEFIDIPDDDLKQQLNIEHLLTMSTGLEWNEDYSRQEGNDYYSMIRSENWIEYVLDKTMVDNPNSAFLYNSGASHLLSAILQISTGNTSLDFARDYLFTPLGITNFEWETDPLGIYRGESMMRLIPRDMAKIGLLYLMNGTWEENEIMSNSWVNTSVRAHIEVDESKSYGYQWWVLPDYGAYYALGWGQQIILVVPEYDLLVVLTARTTDVSTQTEVILTKWILPALGVPIPTKIIFRFNFLIVAIAVCPSIVLGMVLIFERFGLWNETDS